MVTAKTYNAIADALRSNGASSTTVAAIADALAPTNPRFDRDRFVAAATPEETP